MSDPQDREKNLKALVDATRNAGAIPTTEFWKELEQRMEIRDESTQDLVKPRIFND